ncbi:MAG: DHH family phosphoesterase [Verrucomicrobiales bacterium]|nr:DHH family phosphoesterase [Verrucomicrobiales bacterium]
MEALTQPDVILTHESDLDGFVAGHLLRRLARHLFQAEVRLEAWNTQAWRQRPLKEKSAWVCDFSFEARLDRPGWLVIDHHPTDLSPKSARLIHNPEKSAALLCYDLCRAHGLHSPALDRMVQLTDIGDLFLESHTDFILAQDYAGLVKTYQFWNLSKLIDGDVERLLDHPLLAVIRAKREVEDPLGLAWSRQRITEVAPGVACVDVAVGNANLIVHALLGELGAPYRVLATLVKKATTGVVVSLRSRDGEALPIAQKLQGGGHPNAAGATLPRSIQSIPDAVDYLRRVLNPQPVQLAAFAASPTELRFDA